MSKIGWFGVAIGSFKVTGNSIIRWSAYEFLLAFRSNYVSILHRFSDTARYWSKIADCNRPHLYLALLLGVTPLELHRHFWRQKTGVPWLSFGVICLILRLAVFVQCPLVTDRRTDRQTHDDSIYRASIASRGKNGWTWDHAKNAVR